MTDTRVSAPASALPAWARVADFAWMALAAAALVVDMSGGFVLRVGGGRLAVKSPLRLLLWAVGIAIVRHVVDRRQPVYRYLPGSSHGRRRPQPRAPRRSSCSARGP